MAFLLLHNYTDFIVILLMSDFFMRRLKPLFRVSFIRVVMKSPCTQIR